MQLWELLDFQSTKFWLKVKQGEVKLKSAHLVYTYIDKTDDDDDDVDVVP